MYEYKVLKQKDRFFSPKFTPEKLEAALNALAAEGWRVVGITTSESGSGFGSRDEMLVILGRQRI